MLRHTSPKTMILSLVTILGLAVALVYPVTAQGPGPGPGPCWHGQPSGQHQGHHGHHQQGYRQGRGQFCAVLGDYVTSLPVQDLNDREIAALLYNREEEKLARDVYRVLADQWNVPVFHRIAQAEERHMAHMVLLLERYGLEDPIADDTRGVFNDAQLAGLFESLTAEGEASLVDAFQVGAAIEDMDLADLDATYATTDNTDLRAVYQNLMKATRNHMRTFLAELDAHGASYTARHLDAERIAEIAATPHERGVVYDENGEVIGKCGNGHRGFGRGRRSAGN